MSLKKKDIGARGAAKLVVVAVSVAGGEGDDGAVVEVADEVEVGAELELPGGRTAGEVDVGSAFRSKSKVGASLALKSLF